MDRFDIEFEQDAVELRSASLELRSLEENGETEHRAGGLAVPINRHSLDLGGFREIIMPTALNDAFLRSQDPGVFVNHDQTKILARYSANTLRFWEVRSEGWHYDFSIPGTSYGKDLLISLQRGEITQSSFGFAIDPDDQDAQEWLPPEENRNFWERRIHKIHRFFDFSPVPFAAYGTNTSVAVRSLEKAKKTVTRKHYIPHNKTFLHLKKFRHGN